MKQPNRKNIVVWTIKMLKDNHAKDAHDALKTINGIGDKIASLWLSDIAYWFKVKCSKNKELKNEELLFPVDIWVRRTAFSLTGKKKCMENKNDPDTAKLLTRKCNNNRLSPEKVNMGIWYMGAEIADSEYLMKKAMRDANLFERLTKDHLSALKRAEEFADPAISLGKVSRNHFQSK